MSQNEKHEINLSVILDGELSGEELCQTIDALIDDGELIGFWKKARKLQKGLNSSSAENKVENLSDGIWNNIEKRSGLKRAKIFSLNRIKPSLVAAAASIALVLGLSTSGLMHISDLFSPADKTIELSSKGGHMSEERFIELTSEILQADSRYHRKMLEVMQIVNERAYGGTQSERQQNTDLASARTDDIENNQGTNPRRQSERSSNSVEFNLW